LPFKFLIGIKTDDFLGGYGLPRKMPRGVKSKKLKNVFAEEFL